MIRLLLEPMNLLILDEPTNHLDMRSKDVLKSAIRDFDGTVIVVSHDRDFLDGLVSRVYEFGGGKVREYIGGIYDFLEKKRKDNEGMTGLDGDTNHRAQPEVSVYGKQADKKGAAEESGLSAGRLSYEEQKELMRRVRKAEKAVKECEERIEKLEKDISDIEIKMATPEGAADMNLISSYADLKKRLDAVVEEWETASLELDEIQQK